MITPAQAAALLGVSRQAVDQAIARSSQPPECVEIPTADRIIRLYEEEVIVRWWQDRITARLHERRPAGDRENISVLIRIRPSQRDQIDALRQDGESRAAVLRRLILGALESSRETAGSR